MYDVNYFKNKEIWRIFKEKIKEKNYTLSDFAKKIWTSQPRLSDVLKWKWSSDEYFVNIWEKLWLTKDTIDWIFLKGYQTAIQQSFWDKTKNLLWERDLNAEEIDDLIKDLYDLSWDEFDRLVKAIKS